MLSRLGHTTLHYIVHITILHVRMMDTLQLNIIDSVPLSLPTTQSIAAVIKQNIFIREYILQLNQAFLQDLQSRNVTVLDRTLYKQRQLSGISTFNFLVSIGRSIDFNNLCDIHQLGRTKCTISWHTLVWGHRFFRISCQEQLFSEYKSRGRGGRRLTWHRKRMGSFI